MSGSVPITNSAFKFIDLTLANGMTAGVGPEQTDNRNWGRDSATGKRFPFTTYGGPSKWGVKRVGVMRNVPGSLPSGKVYGFYFQYNPNEITSAWQFNPNNVPYAYLVGNQTPVGGSNSYFGSPASGQSSASYLAAPNILQGQSISWSLLFDRTYDLLYSENPDENRGVLKDVAALYNVMGTFETVGATPQSTPVQVMFAKTASGAIWGFTGNITGLTITYGIFRHNMIPARAEIDLTMSVHYVMPSVPGVSPGNGQASQVTNAQVNNLNNIPVNSGVPGSAAASGNPSGSSFVNVPGGG